MIFLLHTFIGMLVSVLLPHAHAQSYIQGIIGTVGEALPTLGTGSNAMLRLAELIISQLRAVLFIVGTLVITILGFRMIIGQEDESTDKAKTTIIAVISGIMIAMLIEPFVMAFYGVSGEALTSGSGAGIVETQVGGIIDWVLSILGIIALLMIIISGLRAVATPLSEEGIAGIRNTIFSVVAGMLVLIFRVALSIGFGATGTPDTGSLIGIIVQILTFVLIFVALAAVIVIIYAGILMVLNFGNDEAVTRAKGIIQRAVIGIIIVLLSIGIVQFVIGTVA